ncbi:MAG TPA: flagellar biosynthesis protein FlgH [Gallionellaceae bacterium]|nr:flagellar biosynthesis protein FlgH [Gallionellaceae bacterium]
MNKAFNAVWIVAMAALLSACVPSTNIKQPLTARPAPKTAQASESNGSIFQAGVNERPMFEDRRARNVGDVLIINIAETTSASGKSGNSADNSGSIALATPLMTGVNGATVQGSYGAAGSSSVKSASKTDSSGSNSFSGAITVTVTEVLPNGNLRVAGEKQVAIKHSEEYVRFSGVVNPSNISSSNTVQSTQVAEVHVEYKGAQNIDAAAVTTMFNRFFFSILPF